MTRPKKMLLAVGAFFALTSQAQAMCVYNDMDTVFWFELECGMFCSNDWRLLANEYACRTGKGGTLLGNNTLKSLFSLPVDPHGYAVVDTIGDRQRRACAYASDDTQQRCVYFTHPVDGHGY